MDEQNRKPVWLITGCSTGFGHDLARLVLERGYRAIVTARDPARVQELVAQNPNQGLAAALDVTDASQIAAVVSQAEAAFGGVDVLVNNAGYGYLAAVEEGEDDEIRAMFETNVFGLFALTRAVLPGMRARRRGHVINISSVGGLVGNPGSGYYAATKFAVEGFSERDPDRAGAVPHRLGRPLAEADAEQDCRICGHRRRPPPRDPGDQRQAARGSGARRPGDH